MNYNQHHKQTREFLDRVEIVKRYMYENRDIEVAQMEVVHALDISRTSAKSALEHLEDAGVIGSRNQHGKCIYSWRDANKDSVYDALLRCFLAKAVIREPVREFRV